MRRKDREIDDPLQIDEILSQGDTCHLALCTENEPYCVALNYGFERVQENTLVLYFHCAKEGKKLTIIRENPRAAFVIDTSHSLITGALSCDWGMKYKSVAGSGSIVFVENDEEKKHALDLLMIQYGAKPDFTYDPQVFAMTEIVKLVVESYSGKEKK